MIKTMKPLVIPKFKIQRFARDPEDVTYRGRRRWSGNYGMVVRLVQR